MKTLHVTCAVCHSPFNAKPGVGRTPKYCSPACKARRVPRAVPKAGQCEQCGEPFATNQPKRRYCSDGCRRKALYHAGTRSEATCSHCGKSYHPKSPDRTSFCSRACCFAHRNDGIEGRRAQRQARQKRERQAKRQRVCEVCGGRFDGPIGTRYCSEPCRYQKHRDSHLERSKARYSPVAKSERTCTVCRNRFFSASRSATCCSPECGRTLDKRGRKQANHRRRVRIRGGEVERFDAIEIYERDGWRCQLCGRQVLRDAVAPSPMSPTLDHIIPVARGGGHTRVNVQCAHFICNARKRDTVAGVQLRLIG